MNIRKILYGTGVAGAMTGAFLAGSIALQPVFAQTPPATTQQSGSRVETETGEKADGNAEVNKPETAETNDAAETAALQALAKISLDQAKQFALGQFQGGTIQGTGLSDENGAVVYEIVVVDQSGVQHEVKVDATTGKVAAGESEQGGDGEGAD